MSDRLTWLSPDDGTQEGEAAPRSPDKLLWSKHLGSPEAWKEWDAPDELRTCLRLLVDLLLPDLEEAADRIIPLQQIYRLRVDVLSSVVAILLAEPYSISRVYDASGLNIIVHCMKVIGHLDKDHEDRVPSWMIPTEGLAAACMETWWLLPPGLRDTEASTGAMYIDVENSVSARSILIRMYGGEVVDRITSEWPSSSAWPKMAWKSILNSMIQVDGDIESVFGLHKLSE